METTLQPILFAIGIGLLFFPGLFLLTREKTLAPRILGISFLVIGFNLFNSYLIQTGLMREYSYFFRSASSTHYLFGPLGYFFIRFLFQPNLRWRLVDWLHFIPFVLHSIEMIPFLSLSAEEKRYFYLQYQNGPLETNPLGLLGFKQHVILKALHILAYQGLIFINLRPYFQNWREHLASAKRHLFVLVAGDFSIKCMAYLVILVLFQFNHLFSNNAFYLVDMLYSLSYISCSLFMLAYPGLMQEAVKLTGTNSQDTEPHQQDAADLDFPEGGDAEVFAVRSEEQQILIARLEELMESRRLYLQESMNLQSLADEIGVKGYKLSRVIKECYGLSYSDYINRYRIQYIEEKVRTDELWKSYSIESMAFQAGFGSRAAFYLAFRKVHSCSPAEYFGLKTHDSEA